MILFLFDVLFFFHLPHHLSSCESVPEAETGYHAWQVLATRVRNIHQPSWQSYDVWQAPWQPSWGQVIKHQKIWRQDFPRIFRTLFSLRAEHRPSPTWSSIREVLSLWQEKTNCLIMDFKKTKTGWMNYAKYLEEKRPDLLTMEEEILKRRRSTTKEEDSRRPSIVYEEDMPVIVRRRGVTMTVRSDSKVFNTFSPD